MNDAALQRYARLLLEVGLDFTPGGVLAIDSGVAEGSLAQALSREAYAQGAAFVDVWYWDPLTRAARIEYAPRHSLSHTPSWLDARYNDLASAEGSYVRIVGGPQPELLSHLDEVRVGLDRTTEAPARYRMQILGLVEWAIACCPTEGWAQCVLGEDASVEELWRLIERFVRLDQPDPVASWRAHVDRLEARATRLNELALEAVRFVGPGTDLNVGLLPDSRWLGPTVTSRRGRRHVCNLPTEEVYTTPDPTRADGVVRSSKPLAIGGTVVEGLELRFANGRIVDVSARSGAEVVRASVATDAGASRLGELALVDAASPIATSNLTYFATLLDENAASHLAWGQGIPAAVRGFNPLKPEHLERDLINRSSVHKDFMVGDAEVSVLGVDRAGREHVLADNNVLMV